MRRVDDFVRIGGVVAQVLICALASPAGGWTEDEPPSQEEVVETSLAQPGTWGVNASALLVGTTAIFPKDDYAKVKVSFMEEGVLKADFAENADVGEIRFERVPWGFCNLVTVRTTSEQDRLREMLLANPLNNLMQKLLTGALAGVGPMELAEAAGVIPPEILAGAARPEEGLPKELKRLTVRYDVCYWVRNKNYMPKKMEAGTREKVNWFLAVVSPTSMWSSTMADEGPGMVQWHEWTRIGD